jgi:hypothetical protein
MDDADMRSLAADAARRAAPVFEREGWEWRRGDGDHVPSVAEIEADVLQRLREVEPGHQIDSGRLSVWRGDGWESEWYSVSLTLGEVVA